MHNFTSIAPAELQGNPFSMIGTDWMLIASKKNDRVNMMTASWGGLGILWGKPVAFVFIRPQRFTKGFVDTAEGFSCTFFDETYRKQLQICGAQSGRDIDKVAECGFDVLEENGVPYFAQAKTVLLCEKLYRQPLAEESFLVPRIVDESYPQKDFHDMYVGEITKVLIAK